MGQALVPAASMSPHPIPKAKRECRSRLAKMLRTVRISPRAQRTGRFSRNHPPAPQPEAGLASVVVAGAKRGETDY